MSKKIIIIDDNQQDRDAIAVALNREGFEDILFSELGQEGLEKVKANAPEIILIDVVLKNVDGFDICSKIRAIEGYDPKIIMVTGHLDAVDAEKARTSGANEIMEKTPGFKNLGEVVKIICS